MSDSGVLEGRGRVLIVDDEPDNGDCMAELLNAEGFGAEAVRGGEEAIEWVRENGAPSVVLLDLMMPVVTGWDVLSEWTHDGEAPLPFPVIIVSACSDSHWDARQYDVAASLRKPVNLSALFDLLDQLHPSPTLPSLGRGR